MEFLLRILILLGASGVCTLMTYPWSELGHYLTAPPNYYVIRYGDVYAFTIMGAQMLAVQ